MAQLRMTFPEVDEVKVKVIMDNSIDLLMANTIGHKLSIQASCQAAVSGQSEDVFRT